MHDEDDELMLRLQGGDRHAFAELVQRHQSPLIGFFFRQLRDWQLGEDLSQETLLRIHNTAWDYLPRGLFKAWMYRIARNLLIDTTRKRSHDALVRSVRSRPGLDGDESDDIVSRLPGDILQPGEQADEKRNTSETPRTTSHAFATENENPLVLQGNPTKQGGFRTQPIPPTGVEPFRMSWGKRVFLGKWRRFRRSWRTG